MNPDEVPADFLSVAEQLSRIQLLQKDIYITLIKHAFQSTLGTKYALQSIHNALEAVEEKEVNIYDEQDGTEDDEESQGDVSALIVANDCDGSHRASIFSTISSLSTTSKDSMFSTLSVTSESYPPSLISFASGVDSDYFDDSDEFISSSPVTEKGSPKSGKVSCRLYRFFIKPKHPRMLCRAKSLGNSESKDISGGREMRSNSLPQQVRLFNSDSLPRPQNQTLRHICFRRRPILSSDEDNSNTTLRVVVFGADHVAGKVARAYSSLRKNESMCPRLTRAFNLQFYFVPVKRDSVSGHRRSSTPLVQIGSPKGTGLPWVSTLTKLFNFLVKKSDSTNDIAHLLGMLDPWYERNTLSLLKLPTNVVCQLTLACGERRTEVFIHSLELGHTAGTRAIKAMGERSTQAKLATSPHFLAVNCFIA
ncbi:hypothetical protein XENOCAPTIV_028838 [Xenoophorus captivus]|uniref:Phosphoinositide 3-kinase regulatory subunit 5 n=1 Tax=Xenoophorus captivus TaxID=1517983 RepID=A0ABV0RFB9_9TELE